MHATNDGPCATHLQELHGIEIEQEMMELVGKEVAIDIQMEIRHSPQPIEVYTLHVPPMKTPSFLDPKDFTICRGLTMSYSKEPRAI